MNPPSFITVNLPYPGSIPPYYYYGYFYAPNTLIIDKDGQRAYIGAVGIDLSDENGLIMFKLYKCELTSEEAEKCVLLREDAITEDFLSFLSYALNEKMEYRFVLLDDGDSFILVYANVGIKEGESFRDFGKALSFY
ncbi:MAG: hypothetical protein N3F67_06395, partial [Acidilobaceae archaeon]|nr:hypothetical protein [Acidilobaceae archaeon]